MKQKLMAALLVLCMVVALVPAIAVTSAAANGVALPDGATAYDGNPSTALTGNGTEADPFIIANTADFMCFYESVAATATADQHFKMTGDVYWNAKNSTTYKVSSKDFAGVLDGNGHTVYNAYWSGWKSVTVFGTVTGTIKNLTFEGTKIDAGNGAVGGVCLTLNGGTIDKVQLKNASIGGMSVGGITQSMKGANAVISNCSMAGELYYTGSKNGSIGGIIECLGDNGVGTIENCVNRATVPSNVKIVTFGGIVANTYGTSAEAKSLTVKNCQNYSDFTTTGANALVGGVVGSVYRTGSISLEDCTNYGTLSGTGATGGMVGGVRYMDNSTRIGCHITMQGCDNRGNIASTGDNVGGFVGSYDHANALEISRCANYADVSGVNNVGGMVGKSDNGSDQNLVVSDSAVYGNVTASGSLAGLIAGYHPANTITADLSVTNCVLSGAVSAVEGASAVAGSSGHTPTVTNTYFSGVAGLKLVAMGTAVTEATATDTDFTGKTVLDALNKAAVVAGLSADTWVMGQTSEKPELKQFCLDPVEEPAGPAIPIDGASLTIGNSVTLNLFVNKTTLDGVTFENIYVVSENGEYLGKISGDKYVFEITGLTAKEFGENKSYTVRYTTADGSEVTSTVAKEYSPLQYAINMYGKRADMPTLDPLLLSIVTYADAAGATNAKSAFEAAHADDVDRSKLPAYATVLGGDKGSYDYAAATLPKFAATLTEKLALTVNLGTDYTALSVKIGETELAEVADGVATVSNLWATDLYNTMTLTYTKADGTTETCSWSLMQYLNSLQGTSDEALAEATAIYLYAAREFCLANHN